MRAICIQYKIRQILTNTNSGLSKQTKTSSNTNQNEPIQSNTHQYIVNRLLCIEYKRYVLH